MRLALSVVPWLTATVFRVRQYQAVVPNCVSARSCPGKTTGCPKAFQRNGDPARTQFTVRRKSAVVKLQGSVWNGSERSLSGRLKRNLPSQFASSSRLDTWKLSAIVGYKHDFGSLTAMARSSSAEACLKRNTEIVDPPHQVHVYRRTNRTYPAPPRKQR